MTEQAAAEQVTYHGRRAVVVERRQATAPSGDLVRMTLLRFPRGGTSWVLSVEVRPRTEQERG